MSKQLKQIFSLLVSVVMIFSMFAGINLSVSAEDDIINYLEYYIANGEVTITDCDESINGDVVIPDKIEGYPVAIIGWGAFSDCENITSIKLPVEVSIIDRFAFNDCRNLKSITIPYGVTSIGNEAFNDCKSLESVAIPSSMTVISARTFINCGNLKSVLIPDSIIFIGDSAFENCYALDDVIIPDSVISIGNGAFWGCIGLKKITIPENSYIGSDAFYNIAYYNDMNNWVDGVLYIGTQLAKVKNEAISENFRIKEGTSSISANAFSACYDLTDITIPDSVISIGNNAFANCIRLENITIPDSVKSVGYGIIDNTAFYNNENNWDEGVLYVNNHLIAAKKEISGDYIIKDGTVTISPAAFSECEYLTSIAIPDGVVSISDESFSMCGRLESVNIPDSVKTIGSWSFGMCSSLNNIRLSDSLTSIGATAFGYCSKIESITIPYGVKEILGSTFVGCSSLKDVYLPESLIYIDESFQYCVSLESINIPKSVISISNWGFLDCPQLKDIKINNPATILGTYSVGYTTVDILMNHNDYAKLYNEMQAAMLNGDEVKANEISQQLDEVTYYYNEPHPVQDAVIHGYIGSTAEAYAKEQGFKFVPICGHVNTETINIVEADCKNAGYTGDVYCKDCEEIISDGETVPATDHDYIENIIKEPTFTQPGLKNDVCENCGDATAEEEIPQLTIEDSEEKENADTDISIIYPDGTFDGEIEVEVTPVEEGEAYKLISHKEGNYKVTMFDINITVDGEKVQPDGTVLVKIPLPKGYNQNKCAVYYVADDETMEELKTYHYKDGYVYFETDHFSYYAILETVENTPPEEDNTEASMSFFDKIIAFFKKIIEFIKNLFA